MIPKLDCEKNRLMIFNTQCINSRIDLKNDKTNLRKEMLDEVDNLQIKLVQNINRQKIETNTNNMETNKIKNEFLNIKNLICELKSRINSLKLGIDGSPAFNADGFLVLNTKIEK